MTGAAFDKVFFLEACCGKLLPRAFVSIFVTFDPENTAFDLLGADSGAIFDRDFVVDVLAALCCSFSRLASLRAFFFASFQGDESIPLDLNCTKDCDTISDQVDNCH